MYYYSCLTSIGMKISIGSPTKGHFYCGGGGPSTDQDSCAAVTKNAWSRCLKHQAINYPEGIAWGVRGGSEEGVVCDTWIVGKNTNRNSCPEVKLPDRYSRWLRWVGGFFFHYRGAVSVLNDPSWQSNVLLQGWL